MLSSSRSDACISSLSRSSKASSSPPIRSLASSAARGISACDSAAVASSSRGDSIVSVSTGVLASSSRRFFILSSICSINTFEPMSSAKSVAADSPLERAASLCRKMDDSLARADCSTVVNAVCSCSDSIPLLYALCIASAAAQKSMSACDRAERVERSSMGTQSEVPAWRAMARSVSYFSRCARRSSACFFIASARACSISSAIRSFSSNDCCCRACSCSISLSMRVSVAGSPGARIEAGEPPPPAAARSALSSSISRLSLPTSVSCSFFRALSWIALARSAYCSVERVSSRL
mmetsp:Transcript_14143/g.47166  ORF Transcript_14143/g.47166 Transcript_14143/m.47166 type:complete len:294 (+) Transcript_14143:2813-3694(+)